jgi:hydroxylamine reductase (hybrid-cluster protein)
MNERIVLDEEEMPKMSSPNHFKHCVDLIRQALMCQPDLTLELKNEMMGGVAGFGTEHVCTNWGKLMEFVERWEDWGRS